MAFLLSAVRDSRSERAGHFNPAGSIPLVQSRWRERAERVSDDHRDGNTER
jgi:hypothetical protein